ncbi:hypothetical protein LINGRAHAP2_LOCUS7019 [Linum grandiflorum]
MDHGVNDSDSEDPNFEQPTNQTPNLSYRGSSQSDHEVDDKIDGEEVSSYARQPYYDPNCDHSKLVWKEGLKFTSTHQFKDAIVNFTIAVGADIKWKRANKVCREAVCTFPGCKLRVYASWFGRNVAFVVKAVGDAHTYPRTMHIRHATVKWIAKHYLTRFKRYPELDTMKLAQEIKETHEIEVSTRVCSNAKQEAKKMTEGTLREAYAKLRTYLLHLKTADPEGKFVLEVDLVAGHDDYVLFRRIFIRFSCLTKGFRQGCRKMFALDGCFLKGEVQGMILTCVGKDGNNQMFSVAWVVVGSENRSSWQWFILLIQEILELDDGHGWSVISDQQKVIHTV